MRRRWTFDVGEIEFVAENMECMTREYIIATYRAALARARRKDWSDEARARMRLAAEAMKIALDTWPKGKFDSALANGESQ